MATSESPKVGIIMGSQSDWPVMKEAARLLGELGVAYESRIVSAHRTPDRLVSYAKDAKGRGLKVIIAGRRRGRAPARHDRRHDPAAGAGRAGPIENPVRPRQPAVDRADAARRSGRHPRHRRSGRSECRHHGRLHRGAGR
jgi:hypothetical protein